MKPVINHAFDDPYFPRSAGAKHLVPPPAPAVDLARFYDSRGAAADVEDERPAEAEPLTDDGGMMTGRQLLVLVWIGLALWAAVIGGAWVVVSVLK